MRGLRERLRSGDARKHDAEIRWWVEHFDAAVRAGGWFPGDVGDFIEDDAPAADYWDRRRQIARAEVVRVLREAAIEDRSFFDGKVVLDIGPGVLGFPDACPARVSFGVDPLAQRYRDHGLLIDSDAIYLSQGAERIPIVSGTVDVVLARNSLDHVDDPAAVVAEARRLLRPGGTLILNFDVGTTPTATEPHVLTEEQVLGWLDGMRVVHHTADGSPHGEQGHAVVLVASTRPDAAPPAR